MSPSLFHSTYLDSDVTTRTSTQTLLSICRPRVSSPYYDPGLDCCILTQVFYFLGARPHFIWLMPAQHLNLNLRTMPLIFLFLIHYNSTHKVCLHFHSFEKWARLCNIVIVCLPCSARVCNWIFRVFCNLNTHFHGGETLKNIHLAR